MLGIFSECVIDIVIVVVVWSRFKTLHEEQEVRHRLPDQLIDEGLFRDYRKHNKRPMIR